MNIADAINELKQGKRITRPVWGEGIYLAMVDDIVKPYCVATLYYQYDQNILITTDWETLDGTKQNMTFPEMLSALKEGHKTRRSSFAEGSYLILSQNKQDIFIKKIAEHHFIPTYQCLDATDWEAF